MRGILSENRHQHSKELLLTTELQNKELLLTTELQNKEWLNEERHSNHEVEQT